MSACSGHQPCGPVAGTASRASQAPPPGTSHTSSRRSWPLTSGICLCSRCLQGVGLHRAPATGLSRGHQVACPTCRCIYRPNKGLSGGAAFVHSSAASEDRHSNPGACVSRAFVLCSAELPQASAGAGMDGTINPRPLVDYRVVRCLLSMPSWARGLFFQRVVMDSGVIHSPLARPLCIPCFGKPRHPEEPPVVRCIANLVERWKPGCHSLQCKHTGPLA